jgi:hypothetical protein
MTNLYNYIKSNVVKNVYLKNLWRIKEYNEYQHFLSRLSIVDKTIKVSKDIYSVKINELNHIISSNPEKTWELSLEQDNNGYLSELNKVITQEIKYYVHYCRIFDNLNVLRRNNIDFDFESVKHFFDDDIIEKMCNISYNETLRELEGTICVNGIGYLLPFIDSYISEKSRKIVLKTFVDLYSFYANKCEKSGFINRNYVYGLTHCIIDISDFYTKDIYEQTELFLDEFEIEVLYIKTIRIINKYIKASIESKSELNIKDIKSDMIAELLVVYKLLVKNQENEKIIYEYSNYINLAYQELCRRVDIKHNYIRDNKDNDFSIDLKINEHTNILFILFSRL